MIVYGPGATGGAVGNSSASGSGSTLDLTVLGKVLETLDSLGRVSQLLLLSDR
jgi:hypothetical protein